MLNESTRIILTPAYSSKKLYNNYVKTLFLASNGNFVTEEASKFLPRPLQEMKIAYITTASKGVPDKRYVEIRRKRMNELKYEYEEIDIDGKIEDELRKILKDKDVIYVEGGNTFYLLKRARKRI